MTGMHETLVIGGCTAVPACCDYGEPQEVTADAMWTAAATARLRLALEKIREVTVAGRNWVVLPDVADHVASALRDRGFEVKESWPGCAAFPARSRLVSWE